MGQGYRDRIERVRRHILANPEGDLSLDALAAVAALSRFHFHRVYAAMAGETVAETVRRARLNRAAVAVAMTARPLAEIARAHGYADADSLARAFRAGFGLTLGEVRQSGRVPPALVPQAQGDLPMYDVEIRDLPPMEVAALLHVGPYPQIGAVFDRLGKRLAAAGLSPGSGAAVALYYDTPGTVAEAEQRSHAAITVPPGTRLPAEIERLTIPGGRHAVLTVRGPFSGIPAGWAYLYRQWLPASGETPADRVPFELYPDDMAKTPPEEVRTEICVPLV